MTKQDWQSIAKLLRKRGWNYHRIEWLLPNGSRWRVSIQQCKLRPELNYEEVEAERKTLLACYETLLAETERPRVV